MKQQKKEMSLRVKNELLKRVNNAVNEKIFIPNELTPNSHIRGVYCFYAVKEEEIPFYIGKSNNIFNRMFNENGHIYAYLRNKGKDPSAQKQTDVQKRIARYLNDNYIIKVKILRNVEYIGDSFIQDANRLALAELEEIVAQQRKGLCLTKDQLSEAVKPAEESIWNEQFNKQVSFVNVKES